MQTEALTDCTLSVEEGTRMLCRRVAETGKWVSRPGALIRDPVSGMTLRRGEGNYWLVDEPHSEIVSVNEFFKLPVPVSDRLSDELLSDKFVQPSGTRAYIRHKNGSLCLFLPAGREVPKEYLEGNPEVRYEDFFEDEGDSVRSLARTVMQSDSGIRTKERVQRALAEGPCAEDSATLGTLLDDLPEWSLVADEEFEWWYCRRDAEEGEAVGVTCEGETRAEAVLSAWIMKHEVQPQTMKHEAQQ